MRPPLRVALLLGSTRTRGPPVVLGKRVGLFVRGCLERRGFVVDIIDPAAPDAHLPLLQQPHFAYARGRAPLELEALDERLRGADAYVCVTPEYNHAPSPALLNLLNHFGSSTFGFKPSAIVSYSGGQWGGVRAAHALRPTLSELGCLPVSARPSVPRRRSSVPERWCITGRFT
ncbi:NADPH-dependent FMN reductase-like protein [Pelagophyceae sp. CCMP2097]|nr:NADPH-dependent FMN reductase-like protein [Pelagophyceae sp. CCMP2097]